MAREIKFRVWDNCKQKMFTDCFSLTSEGCTIQYQLLEKTSSNLIWEQFTGLHDKNGKEIFEGDIISEQGAIVLWDERLGCWCFNFKHGITQNIPLFYNGNLSVAEVIGNIHENPELIPNH